MKEATVQETNWMAQNHEQNLFIKAIEDNDVKNILALLSLGFDTKTIGFSPYSVVKSKHTETFDILKEHNVPVNHKDHKGNTPLHYSIINGEQPKTMRLLEMGANPNIANKEGSSAIFKVPYHNNNRVKTVKALIACGAKVKVKNRHNMLIDEFVLAKRYDLIEPLILAGISPNCIIQGKSLLEHIILDNKPNTQSELIETMKNEGLSLPKNDDIRKSLIKSAKSTNRSFFGGNYYTNLIKELEHNYLSNQKNGKKIIMKSKKRL